MILSPSSLDCHYHKLANMTVARFFEPPEDLSNLGSFQLKICSTESLTNSGIIKFFQLHSPTTRISLSDKLFDTEIRVRMQPQISTFCLNKC